MENEEVGKYVHMLSRQLKMKLDGAIAKYGITGTQAGIIRFIYDKSKSKDIFAKDIEEEFEIKGASVTGILQLMERKELIVRVPVDKDARFKKLVLTKKALKLREDIEVDFNEVEKNMKNGINNDEIKLFLSLIKKMLNNLYVRKEG